MRKTFGTRRAAPIIEMLLPEQPGSGDHPAFPRIGMNQFGHMSKQSFHRHPDIRIESGIEAGKFGFELGLAASMVTHPHLESAATRLRMGPAAVQVERR